MRRKFALLAALVAVLVLVAGCKSAATPQAVAARPTKTPKPTFTPTPDWTPTPEILPTATAAPASPTPDVTVAPTATAIPPSPTPVPAPSFTANQNMNVRRGPGTNYPVIGQLSAGQGGDITGKNDDGDWLQFNYNGDPGWVTRELVTVSGDENAIQVAEAPAPPPTARPAPTQRPAPTSPPAPPPPPSKDWRVASKGNPAPNCGVVHFNGQVQYANGSPRNGVYLVIDYYGPRKIVYSGGGGAGDGNFSFSPCGNQSCQGPHKIYVIAAPSVYVPPDGLTIEPGMAVPANANSEVWEVNITNKCDVGQYEGIVFKSKD